VADLIAQGAQYLTDTRTASLSRQVTYAPKAGGSATVAASIGKTPFQQLGDGGVVIEIESRDFIVAESALAADPVHGDRIREPIGDGTRVAVYLVVHPGNGPVWRWGDAHRTCRRIHTQFEKTEDA